MRSVICHIINEYLKDNLSISVEHLEKGTFTISLRLGGIVFDSVFVDINSDDAI